MFVQVLANIEGDSSYNKGVSFDDVEKSAWYYDAVMWAAEKDIVSGYGNGKFAPNEYISREQMAVMLNNYIKYKGYNLEEKDVQAFNDEKALSSWAKDSVSKMQKYGLISGVGNNTYSPNSFANRGSVAQIFRNLIDAYLNSN